MGHRNNISCKRERNLPLVTTGMFLGKWTSEASPNIELFFIYFGWWDVPWEIFFSKKRGCVLSLFQDDQDEVNQPSKRGDGGYHVGGSECINQRHAPGKKNDKKMF